MNLDEKGFYVDLMVGDRYRTFIDPGELAKCVYHTEGPHIVVGGFTLDCKREGAYIVKNLQTALLKNGVPESKKQWQKLAETCVEIG